MAVPFDSSWFQHKEREVCSPGLAQLVGHRLLCHGVCDTVVLQHCGDPQGPPGSKHSPPAGHSITGSLTTLSRFLSIIAAFFCCYVISDNESPVWRGCLNVVLVSWNISVNYMPAARRKKKNGCSRKHSSLVAWYNQESWSKKEFRWTSIPLENAESSKLNHFLEMLSVDWNSWQKFELTQNAMDYLVLLFSLYL